MDEILTKLRYLDSILVNVDYLSLELKRIHDLRILKYSAPIDGFGKIYEILELIKYLKKSIKKQITFRIICNNSYLDRFNAIKVYELSYQNNVFPSKITNNHKFKIDYKIEFIQIKKEIDLIIKKLTKDKKNEIRNQIIDFNKYCSDYVDRTINKYVLDKMNKYKTSFLI
tara:strand:- start:95 stop:604 length:510 start_codon:yes stop_codon:yes gene_type:complete